MRIAVVDDSSEDSKLLALYIKNSSREYNCKTEIVTYSVGENFLEDEDLSLLDVVFLDIYMNMKNGMEVAKDLRNKGYQGFIIFCTTTADFALEGYSVNALGYIVKPFTYETIAAQLAYILKIGGENTRSIRAKDGRQWCKVNLSEVLYVEKQGNYVHIHTFSKTYSLRMPLGKMEEQLSQYRCFVKCNRGIVVNMENIGEIQNDTILLKNDDGIPISRSKRYIVNECYFDFIFEKME